MAPRKRTGAFNLRPALLLLLAVSCQSSALSPKIDAWATTLEGVVAGEDIYSAPLEITVWLASSAFSDSAFLRHFGKTFSELSSEEAEQIYDELRGSRYAPPHPGNAVAIAFVSNLPDNAGKKPYSTWMQYIRLIRHVDVDDVIAAGGTRRKSLLANAALEQEPREDGLRSESFEAWADRRDARERAEAHPRLLNEDSLQLLEAGVDLVAVFGRGRSRLAAHIYRWIRESEQGE